jgi:hypothetical protein
MGAERLGLLVCVAIGLLLPSAPCAAQEVDARSEAARLFKDGAAAFGDGRYPEAAADFEASHRLVPRAAALYSAARAWDAAGTLERAADDYEGALERTDLHGVEADDARQRLVVIGPRVAVVSVHAPDDARVWLGHASGVIGSLRVHLAPGEYDARVERAGDRPWLHHLRADAGATVNLVAELTPIGSGGAAPPPSGRETPPTPARRDRTWTWLALGAAAAGAISSAVLYAQSSHARDEFDASGDRDPHLRDVALSWRTATYVGYGFTAAALAAALAFTVVW